MKRKALILIISISLISSNIVFATEVSENVEIQKEVKSEIQTEEIPSVDTEEQTNKNTDIHIEKLETIEGQPPSIQQEINGCKFHPRCKNCMEICTKEIPPIIPVGKNHFSACWLNNQTSETP